MAANTLLSAVLMGVFLLIITALLVNIRQWKRVAPTITISNGSTLVTRTVRSPAVWTIGFIIVTLGLTAGAVIFVGGGFEVSQAIRDSIGAVLMGAILVLLVILVFVGVYSMGRSHGMKSAQAVAIGSGLLGLLMLIAITVKLVVG